MSTEFFSQVPWTDLRYLFGEIMYGGHITDDWDRRLCRTYLEEYMKPEMVSIHDISAVLSVIPRKGVRNNTEPLMLIAPASFEATLRTVWYSKSVLFCVLYAIQINIDPVSFRSVCFTHSQFTKATLHRRFYLRLSLPDVCELGFSSTN